MRPRSVRRSALHRDRESNDVPPRARATAHSTPAPPGIPLGTRPPMTAHNAAADSQVAPTARRRGPYPAPAHNYRLPTCASRSSNRTVVNRKRRTSEKAAPSCSASRQRIGGRPSSGQSPSAQHTSTAGNPSRDSTGDDSALRICELASPAFSASRAPQTENVREGCAFLLCIATENRLAFLLGPELLHGPISLTTLHAAPTGIPFETRPPMTAHSAAADSQVAPCPTAERRGPILASRLPTAACLPAFSARAHCTRERPRSLHHPALHRDRESVGAPPRARATATALHAEPAGISFETRPSTTAHSAAADSQVAPTAERRGPNPDSRLSQLPTAYLRSPVPV